MRNTRDARPTMTEPLDRRTLDILDAMSQDKEGSWTTLVERWDSKLRVLLHFRLRDHRGSVDLEDVRQEVWAAAIRGFPRFTYRGPGSFYAWLAQIARHKVMHATRRGRSVETIDTPMPDDDGGQRAPGALLDAIAVTQTSVGGRIANRELERVVKQVVGELPDELREVILLCVYEGLTGRQAAETLGVHESTVSVRLKKAIAACSQLLNDRS